MYVCMYVYIYIYIYDIAIDIHTYHKLYTMCYKLLTI